MKKIEKVPKRLRLRPTLRGFGSIWITKDLGFGLISTRAFRRCAGLVWGGIFKKTPTNVLSRGGAKTRGGRLPKPGNHHIAGIYISIYSGASRTCVRLCAAFVAAGARACLLRCSASRILRHSVPAKKTGGKCHAGASAAFLATGQLRARALLRQRTGATVVALCQLPLQLCIKPKVEYPARHPSPNDVANL